MLDMLSEFAQTMGFFGLTIPPKIIMIIVSCILLYLGIVKNYEPLLLVPIGFGALLVNLPLNTLLDMPVAENNFLGGLLHYLSLGVELGIYPPLIFLGVGR